MKITASLNQWAVSLGMDRTTLRRRLTRTGVDPARSEKLTARQIFKAVAGDAVTAKSRILEAQAATQELEFKRLDGSLHSREDIDRLVWENLLLPVMQELRTMAATQAGLCNPTDPKLSRAVLGQWVDRTLASIKGGAKV